MKKKHKFATLAVHAGQEPCLLTGALVPPLYQTASFAFESANQGAARFAGEEKGYIYSRLGNPTINALEEKVAILEGGESALATASGMAAISTVLFGLLKKGDHMLADNTLYGCTLSLLNHVISKYGIEVSYVDASDPDNILGAVRENTKLFYFESPANPTMKIVDMHAVAQIAKSNKLITIIDGSFTSPYLQRPLEQGIDLVVHSATKYICGHGDVIGGIIVGNKKIIGDIKSGVFTNIGGIMSPFDAWLLLRGLKTLPLRMEKHCSNAMKVAQYLEAHPKVNEVYYPGLSSFPQHELAKKQMDGFGGMLSFEMKGGIQAGERLIDNVGLFRVAVSLGEADSLIQHPATMTHSFVSREERMKAGISDGLVRMSVGIEDAEDLLADLEQALMKI